MGWPAPWHSCSINELLTYFFAKKVKHCVFRAPRYRTFHQAMGTALVHGFNATVRSSWSALLVECREKRLFGPIFSFGYNAEIEDDFVRDQEVFSERPVSFNRFEQAGSVPQSALEPGKTPTFSEQPHKMPLSVLKSETDIP